MKIENTLFAYGRLFILIMAVLLFTGCSGDKNKSFDDKPVAVLYRDALTAMNNQEYKTAAKAFDEVERQHPYSQWATRAKLMSAYSSYQAEDYDVAILTLDNFIELHPGHPDVAYAYYLRAISYYEQIVDVGRDQELTNKAGEAFDEVIRRFPDTTYARDAKFKQDLTRDHMAGKEMEIGRFYLKRYFYQAAMNRFKVVLEKYQTTTHTEEALHRMVEASLALGLKEQAQKYASILGHNYPNSPWYKASYSLLTKGETLQIKGKKKEATTTVGKVKDKFMGLFE
jgi:outer membrane protein assembly factor BamD